MMSPQICRSPYISRLLMVLLQDYHHTKFRLASFNDNQERINLLPVCTFFAYNQAINQSVSQSVSQSISKSIWISLVGATCHGRVNRRRRWMAVSGVACRRSWRGEFREQFWMCPRCQNRGWKQVFLLLFQVNGAETTKECRWKTEDAWGRYSVVVVPERSALSGC